MYPPAWQPPALPATRLIRLVQHGEDAYVYGDFDGDKATGLINFH